jgi:hypothetical protein
MSGSVFVQISDENLHHVREILMKFLVVINFKSNFQRSTDSKQST